MPSEEEKKNGLRSYRTFIGSTAPTVLPRYLHEFANDHTIILDGPTMMLCRGVDETGHIFLAEDGYKNCKKCQCVVCSWCHKTIESETYCILCYTEQALVPLPGE